MPAPIPLPRFVYKIVPTQPPEPVPAEYPHSELDQKAGFVHLSAAWQVCLCLCMCASLCVCV